MENWISASGVQTRNPFSYTDYVKMTCLKYYLPDRKNSTKASDPYLLKLSSSIVVTAFNLHHKEKKTKDVCITNRLNNNVSSCTSDNCLRYCVAGRLDTFCFDCQAFLINGKCLAEVRFAYL